METFVLSGSRAAPTPTTLFRALFTDSIDDELARRLFYVRGDLETPKTTRLWTPVFPSLRTEPRTASTTSPSPRGSTNDGRAPRCRQHGGRDRRLSPRCHRKAFGRDLESARSLNNAVQAVFDESPGVSHRSLSREGNLPDILFFRFGNTVSSLCGIETSSTTFRSPSPSLSTSVIEPASTTATGVLRDMFQNHLLQLLTLIAMEPPRRFDADEVRNEKVKLLSAVRAVTSERVAVDTVRGQYRGYTEAEGVDDASQTATFGAVKLFIDNWRWQGVPFYLRSGKAMSEKVSEILIQFRPSPAHHVPSRTGRTACQQLPRHLRATG